MLYESINNKDPHILTFELDCELASNSNEVHFHLQKICESPVSIAQMSVVANSQNLELDCGDNIYSGQFELAEDANSKLIRLRITSSASNNFHYSRALFLKVNQTNKGSLLEVYGGSLETEDIDDATFVAKGSAKITATGGDNLAFHVADSAHVVLKGKPRIAQGGVPLEIKLIKGNPVSSPSIETPSAQSSPKNTPIVALVCKGGQELPLRIFRQPELKFGKGTDRIGQDVKQPDVALCLLVRDQVNQPSTVITQNLYDQYRKWFETLHFTLYKKGDFIYLKLIVSSQDISVSLNGNEPIPLKFEMKLPEPLKITGMNNPSVVSVSSDRSQKPLVFKLWVNLAEVGTSVLLKPEGEFAFLGDMLWLPEGDSQTSIKCKLGNESELVYEPARGYGINLNGTYTAINKPFTRIG